MKRGGCRIGILHLRDVVIFTFFFLKISLQGAVPIEIEVNGASQTGTNQSLEKGLYRLEYISGAVKFGAGRYYSDIRLTINQQNFVPFASGEKSSVNAVEQVVAGSSFLFQLNESTIINLKLFDSHYNDNGGIMKMRIKLISQIPENLNPGQSLVAMENQSVGAYVGDFNATDPEGSPITYHFVNGDNNNSLFTLETNGTLKTASLFDYESNASTYTIQVQAKDELNATTEGNFTVTLTDVYEDTDGDGFRDSLEVLAGSDLSNAHSTPFKQGLVAWYPFDGNASDMSGNGNHGTVYGATLGTDQHGRPGKAYEFDGVDDYIILPPVTMDSAYLNGAVSIWFKTDNPKWYLFSATANDTRYYVKVLPGGFFSTFGNPGMSSSKYPINSEWNHGIVNWKKSTNIATLYLNGIFLEEISSIQFSGKPNKVTIGSHSPNHEPYEGSIDEVRIYNRTLSATEVLALYNLEKPKIPLTDSNFQTAVNLWFSDEANATATYGHISDWNVSAVTNMNEAFKNRTSFNENISGWDVSKVTNFKEMFYGASSFNQPIGSWNISSVIQMNRIFWGASTFDHPLSMWNTSNVTSMQKIFKWAGSFDQDISDWNVTAVQNFLEMFDETPSLSLTNKRKIHEAFSTNQNWSYDWREFVALDDSNFQTAVNLWFSDEANATATYGHIRDWNTSAVTTMANAFKDRATFNEDISGWDVGNVRTMNHMFTNASSFNQPIGNWDVSSVTTMWVMFRGAISFNQPIGDWDVSKVTSMGEMLNGASSFNQPIGNWDVNNVSNMNSMFKNAPSFNQPIGAWNTSKVTNMGLMFAAASSFNHPVGDWDTSLVTNMAYMFSGASSFNQPIGNWDVNNVSDMNSMFKNTLSFNQPIGDWNTSKVTSMGFMFGSASSFDQDLSEWNLSSVNSMQNVFANASSIADANKASIHYAFKSNPNWTTDWSSYVGNTPLNDSNFQTALNLWFSDEANATATFGHISDWNTSAVTKMGGAFKDRSDFNEDISNWDVSNVTSMAFMFHNAHSFNQPIGDWDVSSVTNMTHMFRSATLFNQDIGDWDTSNVKKTEAMFMGASAFNQPIGGWDVSGVSTMQGMFSGGRGFQSKS